MEPARTVALAGTPRRLVRTHFPSASTAPEARGRPFQSLGILACAICARQARTQTLLRPSQNRLASFAMLASIPEHRECPTAVTVSTVHWESFRRCQDQARSAPARRVQLGTGQTYRVSANNSIVKRAPAANTVLKLVRHPWRSA